MMNVLLCFAHFDNITVSTDANCSYVCKDRIETVLHVKCYVDEGLKMSKTLRLAV